MNKLSETNIISSGSNYRFGENYEPHTNKLLKQYILNWIQDAEVKSVIDLGCGNGAMARDLATVCPTVVGLEPSESGIQASQQNCPSGKFYNMSIYDSPDQLEEQDFDMAVSTEVVEHLYYPRKLPRFAFNKLKSGGLFIISTPYHGWLKNVAISVLNKWDHHHTVFWDGGHIKFWSQATLGRLLEEEGFKVVGFQGCGRLPYLWESMILVGQKP